jgi:hypothetical protein
MSVPAGVTDVMRGRTLISESAALRDAGNTAAALEKVEEAYTIFRKHAGESHDLILYILGIIAEFLESLGRYDEALARREEQLEQQTKTLGAKHRDTIITRVG